MMVVFMLKKEGDKPPSEGLKLIAKHIVAS
jgi:hypothetical protein